MLARPQLDAAVGRHTFLPCGFNPDGGPERGGLKLHGDSPGDKHPDQGRNHGQQNGASCDEHTRIRENVGRHYDDRFAALGVL